MWDNHNTMFTSVFVKHFAAVRGSPCPTQEVKAFMAHMRMCWAALCCAVPCQAALKHTQFLYHPRLQLGTDEGQTQRITLVNLGSACCAVLCSAAEDIWRVLMPPPDGYEDGTQSFLSIAQLKFGFAQLTRLGGIEVRT